MWWEGEEEFGSFELLLLSLHTYPLEKKKSKPIAFWNYLLTDHCTPQTLFLVGKNSVY